MVLKDRFWLLLCVLFLDAFIFAYPVFAEIKVFPIEVEEVQGRDQSQEQVEAFALQKAKRLAVEEAGTYISSLTVVQNYVLAKDEVTALASGVLQSQVLGVPSIVIKAGIVHVTVKAKITVDTAVLDKQIEAFMKDKGALKERDDALKKLRELEDKLSNLKSTEIKRLEELNIQALALERDRDRQRLIREEQSLKAKGELSRAEAERFAKERETQERISRTLVEQEKAKREEATALAAEQDRVKRAQLENEQRWNELSRKTKLSQESWVAIDDSLSLKQAMEEVTGLKQEIANLKGRLDFQYNENTKNLTAAYTQQRTLTTAKLPPAPAPKDAFETTTSYNQRISAYERQVREAEMEKGEAVKQLKEEENLKLTQAKLAYLGQQIRVLAPFIERLQDLQASKFTLPKGGVVTVDLGEPDADNDRFPVRLQYSGKSWLKYWNYTDVNLAKDFYRTRTYLKAEGLFQIEEAAIRSPKLTAVRVTHPGTKETREFDLEKPSVFTEIAHFTKFQQEEAMAKDASEKAEKAEALKQERIKEDARKRAILYSRTNVIKTDGRFNAYDNGTVVDTQTNLMWAAKDNEVDITWQDANRYCENYRGGGYTDWRMPTQDELAELYDAKVKPYKSECRPLFYTMDIHLTELIRLSCPLVWASETRRNNTGGSEAAAFFFYGGARTWWGLVYGGGDKRAIPVRSGKTTQVIAERGQLEKLSEAIERGETAVLKVKCNYASPGYVFLRDGVLTLSKTGIKLSLPVGKVDYGFTVTSDKILEVTQQSQHIHIRIAERTYDRKWKEVKRDYDLYNSSAVPVDVGRDGRILSHRTSNIVCDGCDDTMSVLYALLEKVRAGSK